MFTLPDLPYAYDAFAPVMSGRTLHVHHDKHHAGYIKTVNELLELDKAAPATLEAVIQKASGAGNQKLFNAAAQAWNHSLFWASMSAAPEAPTGALAKAIDRDFGGLIDLGKAFVAEGAAHFGSGWAWLTADSAGSLRVNSTHDAADTLSHPGVTPLLVCDLWEHAYYLDHLNDRKGFLEAWFDLAPNWTFADRQYAAAQGHGEIWRHPPATARAELSLARAG
jgi:Fe-Mn family superoxide dismutase